jgi:cytochrome oxidase Cu insertion factor (SCO1/SenC/PrrC family)
MVLINSLKTFACIIALSAVGCSAVQAQVTFRTLTEFPAFKLKNARGEVFTTTQVLKKDKPTVIIYFSPTCKHCQQQTEDITGNIKVFKEVQFLMVTSYPPEDYKSFLETYAIERFDNITFGYDPDFKLGGFLDLETLPGVFVYDKNMQLKNHYTTNLKPQKLYSAIFD